MGTRGWGMNTWLLLSWSPSHCQVLVTFLSFNCQLKKKVHLKCATVIEKKKKPVRLQPLIPFPPPSLKSFCFPIPMSWRHRVKFFYHGLFKKSQFFPETRTEGFPEKEYIQKPTRDALEMIITTLTQRLQLFFTKILGKA